MVCVTCAVTMSCIFGTSTTSLMTLAMNFGMVTNVFVGTNSVARVGIVAEVLRGRGLRFTLRCICTLCIVVVYDRLAWWVEIWTTTSLTSTLTMKVTNI